MPKAKKQVRNANEFKNLGTVHNRAKPDLSLINEDEKMIPFVIVSDDNAGLRYDWWEDEIYEERLDVNGAVFDQLRTMFKDHILSVDNAIGRVENIRIENGQIKCDVYFGSDDNSFGVYRKFVDGILSDVSIGYSIQEVITTEREDEVTEVLVTKFSIHELSAVWKGFDTKAKIGRSDDNYEINSDDDNLEEEVKPDEETDNGLKKQRERSIWLAEKLQ